MNFKKLIFELKDFCRKNSRQARRHCQEYTELSGEEKKELNWNQCKQIVSFAYQNIPYYNQKYKKAGFHPDSLKSPEDWNRIPILEKDEIRTHSEQLILPGVPRKYLAHTSTGGSTGKPLHLYKDKRTHFEAIHWRSLGWYDCAPWDNVGIVNRRVPLTGKDKFINRLLWWPTKRCYLDASDVSENTMKRFLEEINQMHIVYLTGYCGCLEHLADYALANQIHTPSLKLVWTTTSPLRPDVRSRMEKAFGCPIMDQYGCCELANVAVQKPDQEALTVNSDYVHLDIVDDNGMTIEDENIDGDILITDLQTTVFPLIKYRLGDRSHWACKPFTAEDGFPKIAPVRGRITDTVWFSDGGFIDGAYLTTICDSYSNVVSSYQVFQDESYDITLKIVLKPGKATTDPAIESIKQNLLNKIKGRCSLKCEFCDFIPDDRGKRRYVISMISLKKNSSAGAASK